MAWRRDAAAAVAIDPAPIKGVPELPLSTLRAGEKDQTVPPVLVKSTLRAYGKSPAITELKEFAGRGHSLTIDSGWRDVAEYSLSWLQEKGL